MWNNNQLQQTLISGTFHEIRNTAYELYELSQTSAQPTDLLEQVINKSNEILQFLNLDMELKVKAKSFLIQFDDLDQELNSLSNKFTDQPDREAFTKVIGILCELIKELEYFLQDK